MHLHWKLNYLRIGTEPAEPPVLIVPIAANTLENALNSPTDSRDNHIVCFNTFSAFVLLLRDDPKIISLF